MKKKINAKTTARLEEIMRRGYALEKNHRYEEAIAEYLKVFEVDPKNTAASQLLGLLYYRQGNNALAAPLLARAAKAAPQKADLQFAYGAALSAINDHEAATVYYRKAIALAPDYAAAHFNLAREMVYLGQVDAAIAGFRRVLALEPKSAAAYTNLIDLCKVTEYNDDIRAMEALYGQSADVTDRKMLAFGLSAAYGQLADFDKSFEYLLAGNRLHRGTFEYDPIEAEKLFDKLRLAFPAELLAAENPLSAGEPTPVFIVGMPRSGTSLAEQILASHSSVHGAGELKTLGQLYKEICEPKPDWTVAVKNAIDLSRAELARRYLDEVRKLAGTKPVVTDKMPQNFQYLGLIAVLFPNARIIHCVRNPLDTCLSIFTHLFAGHHPYAYDLEELGHYYRLYQGLMAYWQQVLPGRIYTLDYERVVADTETEVRNLLAHCNLPFEAGCLEFFRYKRAVTTLSASQVRQPIYKSSVEGWRRFEKGLAPLRRALEIRATRWKE